MCVALNAADAEACAAIEAHDRYNDTACLSVKRANEIDLACEWHAVQPGEWSPARWISESWTPARWTPEVWTEGSALVRYGEYEVFAQGSLVKLETHQGYYATLVASHNSTDYEAVLLKRSTCETAGNPDIEVLTQEECCGTGEAATECGVCSSAIPGQLVKEPQQADDDGVVAPRSAWPLVLASSVTTKALCEAIGDVVEETCVDEVRIVLTVGWHKACRSDIKRCQTDRSSDHVSSYALVSLSSYSALGFLLL